MKEFANVHAACPVLDNKRELSWPNFYD